MPKRAIWLLSSTFIAWAGACEPRIDTGLDGLLCDNEGRCVQGYECRRGTCVPVGSPPDESNSSAEWRASGDSTATDTPGPSSHAYASSHSGSDTRSEPDTRSESETGTGSSTLNVSPNITSHDEHTLDVCSNDTLSCSPSSASQVNETTTAPTSTDACIGASTRCGATCVDINTDPDHCGRCDRVCPETPGGVASCVAGDCVFECLSGFEICGAECVNINVDADHCGDCDIACEPGQVCASGTCAVACEPGTSKCNDGCDDLTSSVVNCGTCGRSCPAPPGATPSCVGGSCSYKCLPGLAECDASCVDLQTDAAHCGDCDTVCLGAPNGVATCANGTCVLICEGELVDCFGECVDVKSDKQRCGSCTNRCRGNETCVSGVCE